MTETEFYILASEVYLTIILEAGLVILITVNIWRIIIKQGKWRTIPLLFLYIFAFITATFREINLIDFGADLGEGLLVVFYLQPVAKICVGAIQSWIIFELAIRISQDNKVSQNGSKF